MIRTLDDDEVDRWSVMMGGRDEVEVKCEMVREWAGMGDFELQIESMICLTVGWFWLLRSKAGRALR